MPWSSPAFLAKLSDEHQTPRLYLETVPMGFPYSGGHTIGGVVKFSSEPAEGYFDCIVPEACSIRWAVLSPGDWTRSTGTMTIQTNLSIRNVAHTEQIKRCIRGQVWRLRVQLTSSEADAETVWVGLLRNVRWSMGEGYALEFVELIGGLTTRNTRDGTRVGLMSGLSRSNLATAYDGASGSPDSTLEVDDASGFEKEGDGVHLLRVVPAPGSNPGEDADDNPFFLTATKSGNVFTIVARNIFDTLDKNAELAGGLDGDVTEDSYVEEIAYVARHPVTTAARVLVSTGLGTNGASDVLPERFGLGVSSDLVDESDMSQVQADLESTGYVAYARVDEEQEDGLSWLSGFLQQFGIVLVQRQGQLSVRAVGADVPPAAIIEDHDIIDMSYEAWDGDSPIEYAVWRTVFGTLSETEEFSGDMVQDLADESTAATAPVRHLREWAMPDVFRANLDLAATADTQVEQWAADVPQRLWRWATRPPERVIVRLHRWTTATLCLGDIVELRSDILKARYEAPFEFADGRRGIVVGGGPDWMRGGVTWEILFPIDFDESVAS